MTSQPSGLDGASATSGPRFYGKYRGMVENNIDPYGQGRIQVSVPAVLGEGRTSWAMPCMPYGGPGVGFFAVPPRDAKVWVEFEGGNPDSPIWSGCFWDLMESPVNPVEQPFVRMLKTDNITLKLDDTPGIGGFTLEVNPPASATPLTIKCDVQGISITNGKNKVVLSVASVSINDGALEVI